MKITVCGSIAFYDSMEKTKAQLELVGHEVKLPPYRMKNDDGEYIPIIEYYKLRKKENLPVSWIWDRKEKAMRDHFEKVEWSDIILVLNHDKNDIKGYVGGNTLMEMGLAFHLGKKIYMYNDIPELSYKEEIIGMKPAIINGDLGKIE